MDANRLIMAHGSTLQMNPLQLYFTVMSSIPSDTTLAQTYSSMGKGVVLRIGRDRMWPGHLAAWTGHAGAVKSVAFSSDGTRAVSGSYDKTVRMWDVASGTCTAVLKGHTNWVSSVAFSSNGMRVVSGSRDKTVRMWNVPSATCTAVLQGHTNWVSSVAFSSNGMRVVSCSKDKTVRMWDVASGTCTAVLGGHAQEISSVAFSSDGTGIVSGSISGSPRIWDTTPGSSVLYTPSSTTTSAVVVAQPQHWLQGTTSIPSFFT